MICRLSVCCLMWTSQAIADWPFPNGGNWTPTDRKAPRLIDAGAVQCHMLEYDPQTAAIRSIAAYIPNSEEGDSISTGYRHPNEIPIVNGGTYVKKKQPTPQDRMRRCPQVRKSAKAPTPPSITHSPHTSNVNGRYRT